MTAARSLDKDDDLLAIDKQSARRSSCSTPWGGPPRCGRRMAHTDTSRGYRCRHIILTNSLFKRSMTSPLVHRTLKSPGETGFHQRDLRPGPTRRSILPSNVRCPSTDRLRSASRGTMSHSTFRDRRFPLRLRPVEARAADPRSRSMTHDARTVRGCGARPARPAPRRLSRKGGTAPTTAPARPALAPSLARCLSTTRIRHARTDSRRCYGHGLSQTVRATPPLDANLPFSRRLVWS